ncbi:hypothetical protein HHK36_019506 [Tetracentron sinense]|uniref:Retrotransposon Copia-like N-terminal domain-containing protein n=1 Tax=Tetracentron sinense TaxID=13715 RepID=A0A834Z017_TETSI|nr:hypothetical protein HHK36_019506 [Tetracentron sinense]
MDQAPNNKDASKDLESHGSTNDPFYVSHLDNPSVALVAPSLSGDNYGTWIHAITMALRAKNKLGLVDGTLKKPIDPKELSQWERCNDLVGSWILNSVSTEIRSSISYSDTVRDIWLDLSERFSQSNAPQIYQLKQSISSLKQEDLSVSTYFTKLKSLWNELNSLVTILPCSCGSEKAAAKRLQQDRGMEFLQGLHDRNDALRSQILLMDPFPITAKIYFLVHQEEKQQEIHSLSSPTPDAVALTTRTVASKLVGYPSKKGDTPKTSKSAMVTPPAITQEQYNKLLAMLASDLAQPASPSNVVPLPLSDNPSFDFRNDVHDAHPSPVVPSLVDDNIVAHHDSSSVAPTTPTDPTPSSMEPDSTLSHASTSPPLERPLRFGEEQQLRISSNQMNLLQGLPTNMEPKQLSHLHQSVQSFRSLGLQVSHGASDLPSSSMSLRTSSSAHVDSIYENQSSSLSMQMAQSRLKGQILNGITSSHAYGLPSVNPVLGRNGTIINGATYIPISQDSEMIDFPMAHVIEFPRNGFPLEGTQEVSTLTSTGVFQARENSEMKGWRGFAPNYDILNEFCQGKPQEWELQNVGLTL